MWDMLNWSEDLFDQFPKMRGQRFNDGLIFPLSHSSRPSAVPSIEGLTSTDVPSSSGCAKDAGVSIHGILMGREQKNGLALPRG